MYIYSSSERQIAYIWAKNGQSDKEVREAGNLQEHLEWIFLANTAIFKAKKVIKESERWKNEIKLFTCFLLQRGKKGIS